MSYCRWSSDDFQSDVYVYESSQGYETHVACNRPVFDRSKLPPDQKLDGPTFDPKAWADRITQLMKMISGAERKPIGLPFDGKSFTDETPGEAGRSIKRTKKYGILRPAICNRCIKKGTK